MSRRLKGADFVIPVSCPKQRALGLLSACFCALMAVLLLVGQPLASQGIRRGLSICAGILIPSLFPFMALSGMFAALGADRLLARPVSPLLAPLLGIPPALCGTVLMSFVGGYPVGARLVSQLWREGRIGRDTACRMMIFSFAGAPSFVIGAVGTGVLGGPLQGLTVYLAQIAAALLLGLLWPRERGASAGRAQVSPPAPRTFSQALVEGVSGAASAMISICAFACLFAALTSMLEGWGVFAALERLAQALSGGKLPASTSQAALSGLLEVTCGVQGAAALPYPARFWLVSFLVGFGSLSVLFQAAACFGGLPFSFGRFAAARLLHGVLTSLLAAPVLFRIPMPAQVFSSLPRPAPVDSSVVMGLPAMLGMCSVLLFTLWGEDALFASSRPRFPGKFSGTDTVFPRRIHSIFKRKML